MYKKGLLIIMSFVAFFSHAEVNVFPRSTFDNLSYGLYWFGANNQYEKANSATANGGLYYDRNKPTLILIHGWQSGRVSQQDRFVYFESGGGWPSVDFANSWIAAGYNVGIMYWDQFADESEVRDAEAKIWSATANRDMRWRNSRGQYQSGPNQNVTELLLADYRTAMAGYRGDDIRLAGHSLGNQVALRLADELLSLNNRGQVADNLVPKRVSLLDTFYSNYPKRYLGWRWVGAVARDIVGRLKGAGVAIDSYRTSLVTSSPFVGDENRGLQNQVAFVEQSTGFFNQFQQNEKHGAAIWLYLWSIDYPAPGVTNDGWNGVSAATPHDEVRDWMNRNRRLSQNAGGNTKDPSDNLYRTRSRL